MRQLTQLLLGIPTTFLSLALVSGGFQPAWQIFQISVICTAGISLIVWIPLCWFVGWVVFKVAESMLHRTIVPYDSPEIISDTPSQQNISLTAQDISLIHYIEKGIKQGWSESQITSRLRAQGWKDEEISEALVFVMARLEGNE